jgi:O-methyltransferase
MACDYRGDGFGTKGKSTKFLEDSNFVRAWDDTAREVVRITGQKAPDVRWRAHIAVWAARHGLTKDGDFVECGVHSGIFSGVICRALDWERQNRSFWLFDTWSGVPTARLKPDEAAVAESYNKDYHRRDIFDDVKRAFSGFPSCTLVRGELPETLVSVNLQKIAYLSIDLNNATYEKACIEQLWPKLVPGAIVVLDDYAFTKCRLQQDMWDDFAARHSISVASLPTGQGLIVKP